MERAIHVSNLRNLKYFKKVGYQRLYWGIEFCQNLIPSLRDTKQILKFTKRRSLKFSLVTPFVTNKGLDKLKEIFFYLKENSVKCEVIVNDWGVLYYLYREFYRYFELALGRLLTRQQRDPSMKIILEKQPPYAGRDKKYGKLVIVLHKVLGELSQMGMRSSYINASLAQDFLSKFGIKRVELNNLIQGLCLEGIRLKKSLYIPYINISTTRFCPMESKLQKIYRIDFCNRECQNEYSILTSKNIPVKIYKRGNTTFYRNPLDIKDFKKKNIGINNIDRLVVQPEIPF